MVIKRILFVKGTHLSWSELFLLSVNELLISNIKPHQH